MTRVNATQARQRLCDSHIHFYDAAYPSWAGSTLAHPSVTPTDYEAVRRVNGASRCVVVQPSAYGFDNRVLVNALRTVREAPDRDGARGIAVVARDVDERVLDELGTVGVVGLRANLALGPVTPADLPELAARARERGWHLQLNLTNTQFVELAESIQALPVPVVIDHCAYLCRGPTPAPIVFEALSRFLCAPDHWLKLSAPYVASARSDHADLAPWLIELVRRFPRKLVYGSDWPHVTERAPLDEARLFATQLSWLVGEEARRLVLCSNAARLYGFEDD